MYLTKIIGKIIFTNEETYYFNVSKALKKDNDGLAKVATKEMGKPLKEARSEIEKCANTMEFYAHNGEMYLNDESINYGC